MGSLSNFAINSASDTSPNSFSRSTSALLLILLCAQTIILSANGHGIMVDPIARNSVWRIDGSAPKNYDDTELFCGGIGAIEQTGGKCGVCGDPYRASRPRPHETGGRMATNRTVKNYFPRSTIDVLIQLDTDHGGYFTFELCRRNSFDEVETDECFERLKFADGSDRFNLKLNNPTHNSMKGMSLDLPQDLIDCRACILRWNYHAGNNWGVCKETHGHGREAGMGCGPQELYRNCADISVGYRLRGVSFTEPDEKSVASQNSVDAEVE